MRIFVLMSKELRGIAGRITGSSLVVPSDAVELYQKDTQPWQQQLLQYFESVSKCCIWVRVHKSIKSKRQNNRSKKFPKTSQLFVDICFTSRERLMNFRGCLLI
jgi:hypothetical protein